MKLIYMMIAIAFAGCGATGYYTKVVDSTRVNKINAEELTRATVRYCSRLKHDKGLILEDSRCYYTEYTQKLRLVLSCQKTLEIREARRWITDIAEGYLQAINNNPIIRADLCQQPFSVQDLEIFINFESYYAVYVNPFYIGWIELDEGLVTYYESTAKQWHSDIWHMRFEPYFKALEIANAQKEADQMYPEDEYQPAPLEGKAVNFESSPNYGKPMSSTAPYRRR